MTQHDYTIANDEMQQVRQDIQSALQALASQNSGSGEPSTTYANMVWYEGDQNTLRMRNEANNGWLDLAYVDQADGIALFAGAHAVDATGRQVGTVGVHSSSVWKAGTDADPRLISPKQLSDAAPAPPAGQLCAMWGRAGESFHASPADDYNVSSTTDSAAGRLTWNIDDDMDDSDYSVQTAVGRGSSFYTLFARYTSTTSLTKASSVQVVTGRTVSFSPAGSSVVLFDVEHSIAVFGANGSLLAS